MSGGETLSRWRLKGSGGVAPSCQQTFTVFISKNTHFNTLFYQKRLAVSAVIMDHAKIFAQLMPKSRSLAKISKKRLLPLLV